MKVNITNNKNNKIIIKLLLMLTAMSSVVTGAISLERGIHTKNFLRIMSGMIRFAMSILFAAIFVKEAKKDV